MNIIKIDQPLTLNSELRIDTLYIRSINDNGIELSFIDDGGRIQTFHTVSSYNDLQDLPTVRSNLLVKDKVAVINDQGLVSSSFITNQELSYLKGLDTNIQLQLNDKQPNIIGAASTMLAHNTTPNSVVTTDLYGKLSISATISSKDLEALDHIEDNIQDQLNTKQPVITGAASTVTSDIVEPDMVMISDSEGYIRASDVSVHALDSLQNIRLNIQQQLDTKQSNIMGSASTIINALLQYDSVLITDEEGYIRTSTDVTTTNLSHLKNSRYDIQEQLDAKQPLVTGAASSICVDKLPPHALVVSNEEGIITVDTSIDLNTLSYINQVTSPIQHQIDQKQDVITGTLTTLLDKYIKPSKVLTTDTSGHIVESTISTTELHSLYGVSHSIQDQLNDKQDVIQGSLTSVIGVSLPHNTIVVTDGVGQLTTIDIHADYLNALDEVRTDVTIQHQLDTKQPLVTGAASSISVANLKPDRVLVSNSLGKVSVSELSTSILSHLSNVNADIQTQLDYKQPKIKGAVSTGLVDNFTPSSIVVTDSQGKLATLDVDISKLPYLNDLNFNVQQQLDTKQATITGTLSNILKQNLPKNSLVVTDKDGKLTAVPDIQFESLTFLHGLVSPIQDQLNGKQSMVTGAASSILKRQLSPEVVVVTDTHGKVHDSDVSISKLHTLSDIRTDTTIQSQIMEKQDRITGAVSHVLNDDLEPYKVVSTDKYGKLTDHDVSSLELTYIKGLMAPAQDQLNGKQERLISGETIKSINGQSILGHGDIDLSKMIHELFLPLERIVSELAEDNYNLKREVSILKKKLAK